jgi:hypothetical protein
MGAVVLLLGGALYLRNHMFTDSEVLHSMILYSFYGTRFSIPSRSLSLRRSKGSPSATARVIEAATRSPSE